MTSGKRESESLNMKITVIAVYLLLAVLVCAGDTNPVPQLKSQEQQISVSVNETWASAWIPPATWKVVYPEPVVQSEINVEYKLNLSWLRAIRGTVWIQNPVEEKDA